MYFASLRGWAVTDINVEVGELHLLVQPCRSAESDVPQLRHDPLVTHAAHANRTNRLANPSGGHDVICSLNVQDGPGEHNERGESID